MQEIKLPVILLHNINFQSSNLTFSDITQPTTFEIYKTLPTNVYLQLINCPLFE